MPSLVPYSTVACAVLEPSFSRPWASSPARPLPLPLASPPRPSLPLASLSAASRLAPLPPFPALWRRAYPLWVRGYRSKKLGAAGSFPGKNTSVEACGCGWNFDRGSVPRSLSLSFAGGFCSRDFPSDRLPFRVVKRELLALLDRNKGSVSRVCAMSKRSVSEISQYTTSKVIVNDDVSYLGQNEAIAVDEELFSTLGFSVDQLMELAGLSVASAICEVFHPDKFQNVLIICGPGNNGGDGLVAARHLYHFGYKPFICYPKRTPKPLYDGLVKQLESLNMNFVHPESLPDNLWNDYSIIVDAIFGFSFKGTPRPPFDSILNKIVNSCAVKDTDAEVETGYVVSIDVPSGWDVEKGDINSIGLKPDMLISLTAPKLCARYFEGDYHYLGGRFVPPAIIQKYNLKLPRYPHSSMCVRIKYKEEIFDYSKYYSSANKVLLEKDLHPDPMEQFNVWMEEALSSNIADPMVMALSTSDVDGNPSSRMVGLQEYSEKGFVFSTFFGSRKASELLSKPNSRASLVFWWDKFYRQVRVEGKVEKTDDDYSDHLFRLQSRTKQLMAEYQGKVVSDRFEVDKLYMNALKAFPKSSAIPRPDMWGGFLLKPDIIEFWQGRETFLHDRLRYELRSDEHGESRWTVTRLVP